VSKHRIPHGTYSRGTPDWYVDRLMAGGGGLAAAGGAYSVIGLYNNATDGSMLHVWSVWAFEEAQTTTSSVEIVNSKFGTVQPGQAYNLFPFSGLLAGQITSLSPASQVGGNLIGFLGGGGFPERWQEQGPIAVLSPGTTLVVQTGTILRPLTATFYWVVLGPTQGYY
jgi:hypothetical protein